MLNLTLDLYIIFEFMLQNQPTNQTANPKSPQKEQIAALKHEKEQLHSKIIKLESENIIKSKKIETLQIELSRAHKDIHQLRQSIERQRNQNLKLIQKSNEFTNKIKLEDASTHKYENLNKVLTQQNDRIKDQLQMITLEKVSSTKQKQNALNKLLVAQTKLQALQMQEKFINATLTQLTTQNLQLKSQIEVLNKKIIQKSDQSVKIIRKDSNQSTEHLISEFQEKLYQKELSNNSAIERYEAKIAELNLKIAYLQAKEAR